MDKILVTTDLSKNSKAALRFAISLAQQNKAELIFLHVHYVLRASTWTDNNYKAYVELNEQNLVEELAGFVGGVYRAMKVKPKAYRCDVYHAYGIPESIEQYAKDNGCNYICIATKGAGNVERLWGTNTGKLIRTSSIPVLCIPSNYRAKPITKVLYAAAKRVKK